MKSKDIFLLSMLHCRASVVILILLVSTVLYGQSTGRLSGVVVDVSGAAVPQANVTCENIDTGLVSETTASEQGLFRFPELPIGTYQLSVRHPGFRELIRQDIVLLTGHVLDVRLMLEIGQLTESIEVTGAAPLMQVASSEVKTTYDRREMTDLPLNGRNALQLVILTPGARFSGGGFGGQQVNQSISVNGLRMSDTTFELDGGSYTDRAFNSPPALPNPDALEEFTVQSSNVSAREAGAGAVVQLSTRSGTNVFHGTAFEFLRNDKLDAIAHGAKSKSPFKRNQFGGTFGGPISKDRLFFFGSYQRTTVRGTPNVKVKLVPDAAMRTGDYSGFTRVLVDPANGKPFPGNVIPSNRQDPVALALIDNVLPLPNDGNYLRVPKESGTDMDQFLARGDYLLGPSNRLTGRYFFDQQDENSDLNSAPGVFRNQSFRNQSLSLRDTHIFSPSLVLTNSFTYTRNRSMNYAVTPMTLAEAGATFPSGRPEEPLRELRVLMGGGYMRMFTGGNFGYLPRTIEWRSAASYSRGKHFLQFGGDVWNYRGDPVDLSNENGQFSFNGQWSGSPDISNSGDASADLLLGRSNLFAQGSGRVAELRQTTFGLWANDDWRVHPRLTVNLGIRWDPWLPTDDKFGPLSAFQPGTQSTMASNAPTGMLFSGDRGIPGPIFGRDWNNVAPRIGFAWKVSDDGKFVVRAGYGVFFRSAPALKVARHGSEAPFRAVTVFLNDAPNMKNPYGNLSGGSPFPFSPPPSEALKDYEFVKPVTGSLLDPGARTSYTQSWNFTLERQVLEDLSASLGYVGNHSVKIISIVEANPGLYGPGATIGNIEERRLYEGLGTTALMGPFQDANYHGLQFGITKRTRRGLNIVANYVFSKTIDNASDNTLGGNAKAQSPSNPFDLGANRGPADFDITHTARIALLYDLPNVISSGSRVLTTLLNDWQVNSIITAQTGAPLTVWSGRDNSMSGIQQDRADQIGNPERPTGVIPADEWFNTAAFVENAPGTFGNVGRNSLRGPGHYNVDFAAFKHIPISEKLRLEFRFEAFNFFNHGNLGGPNTTVTDGDFGKITGRGTPRILQFGMKLIF